MIERCSDHADRLVRGIGALPSAELLVKPQINQGLVRFLAADGDHDRRTDDVIEQIQATGEARFGGTTWNGARDARVGDRSTRNYIATIYLVAGHLDLSTHTK